MMPAGAISIVATRTANRSPGIRSLRGPFDCRLCKPSHRRRYDSSRSRAPIIPRRSAYRRASLFMRGRMHEREPCVSKTKKRDHESIRHVNGVAP